MLSNLHGWRPLGWAPDADLLPIEARKRVPATRYGESALLIFDPARDRATAIGVPELVGWGRTSDELIVRNGNRIERWAVKSAAVR